MFSSNGLRATILRADNNRKQAQIESQLEEINKSIKELNQSLRDLNEVIDRRYF